MSIPSDFPRFGHSCPTRPAWQPVGVSVTFSRAAIYELTLMRRRPATFWCQGAQDCQRARKASAQGHPFARRSVARRPERLRCPGREMLRRRAKVKPPQSPEPLGIPNNHYWSGIARVLTDYFATHIVGYASALGPRNRPIMSCVPNFAARGRGVGFPVVISGLSRHLRLKGLRRGSVQDRGLLVSGVKTAAKATTNGC